MAEDRRDHLGSFSPTLLLQTGSPTPHCPGSHPGGKQPGPILLIPLRYLYALVRSPLGPLQAKQASLSLFLSESCPNPLVIVSALCWTRSRSSSLSCNGEPRTAQSPLNVATADLGRGEDGLPQSTGNTLPNAV